VKTRIACGILLSILVAGAQQPATSPAFEVASIKLGDHGPSLPPFINGPSEMRMRFQGGPGSKSPERINYVGVTLKMLIQRAYNLLPEQVIGPDWLSKDKYTVTAKLPTETTSEQCRLMLQNLLSERFQLRLHRETRGIRIYHLVVAKSGPKLTPAEKPRPLSHDEDAASAQARLQARLAEFRAAVASRRQEGFTDSFGTESATVANFAESLSARVDRPVIDRTHLDGYYKFELSWAADRAAPKDDAPQGPSIFAAIIQQLGLELQPATDQFEVLVIEAAERIPVEN
jgi:uncharacterized protein (TIGR03435 family)